MESILGTVKAECGQIMDTGPFHDQLLSLTNAAMAVIAQLGIGPEDGVFIEDDTTTWDALGESKIVQHFAEVFVAKEVHLAFDPPLNSSVLQSMERIRDEAQWRLYIEGETRGGEFQNEVIPDSYEI